MTRLAVSSTNLVSVGYDSSSNVLEVEFKGGTVYQYFDVPPGVYHELMSAPSHGEYFNAYVRLNYRYTRI